MMIEVLCPNAYGVFRFAVKATQRYPFEVPIVYTGRNARSPFIRDDCLIVHPELESWKPNSSLANLIAVLHREFTENAPEPAQFHTPAQNPQAAPGQPQPGQPNPNPSSNNPSQSASAPGAVQAARVPQPPPQPQPQPCPQLTRAQMKFFTIEDLQDLDNETELVKNFVHALEPVTQLSATRDSVKQKVEELEARQAALVEELSKISAEHQSAKEAKETAEAELARVTKAVNSLKNRFTTIALAQAASTRKSELEMLGESLRQHCLEGAITTQVSATTSSRQERGDVKADSSRDKEDASPISPESASSGSAGAGSHPGADTEPDEVKSSARSGRFSLGGSVATTSTASALAFAANPPPQIDLNTFLKNYMQIQKEYHMMNAKAELLRGLALSGR